MLSFIFVDPHLHREEGGVKGENERQNIQKYSGGSKML